VILYINLPVELSIRPDLLHKLVPAHYIDKLQQSSGIDIDNFKPIPVKDLRLTSLD
jgi:glycogen synthase kinase 3 beta